MVEVSGPLFQRFRHEYVVTCVAFPIWLEVNITILFLGEANRLKEWSMLSNCSSGMLFRVKP
jgi:hypothetical protein